MGVGHLDPTIQGRNSGATGATLWTVGFAAQKVTRIGDVTADGVDDVLIGDSSFWFGVGTIGRAIVLDGTDGAVVRVHRCEPVAGSQAMGSYAHYIHEMSPSAPALGARHRRPGKE